MVYEVEKRIGSTNGTEYFCNTSTTESGMATKMIDNLHFEINKWKYECIGLNLLENTACLRGFNVVFF